MPGASDASSVPQASKRQSGEQHRSRAGTVDGEAGGELRQRAGRVEHADQHAKRRPRHVELGPQQREERRQRELEEMGERVRRADEPDNAHIAAERLGGNGLSRHACGAERQRSHYSLPADERS